MEISPAVPAPKSGDPITAKWAADLSAAVNSCANPAERTGETATPYGKATQAPGLPMLGDFRAPMPFDCAVVRPAGASADSVYCYLPPAQNWRNYVYTDSNPCDPSPSQTVGTNTNPWVEVGQIVDGATSYVLLLAFEDITPTPSPADGAAFTWRLNFSDGPTWTIVPNWASWKAPPVIIATFYRSTGIEQSTFAIPLITQYVRGGVNVGGTCWTLGGGELSAYGKAIGNSSKTKVIDLDSRALSGGTWNLGGNIVVNGTTFSQHTVNINGTNYKLLVGA